MKKFLSVAAFAFSMVATSVAANGTLAVQGYVEEIRLRYERLDSFEDGTAFVEARRLIELRAIQKLYEFAANGTFRRTELSGILRLTPSRAVPQLAVSIDQQVQSQKRTVIEAIETCIIAPDTECLLDSAAGASALLSNFDATSSNLSFAMAATTLQPEDTLRTRALVEMIEETSYLARRSNVIEDPVLASFFGPAVLNLFDAGIEQPAFSLSQQYFNEFLDRDDQYFHVIAAIYGAKRWRDGRQSEQEFLAQLRETYSALEPSQQSLFVWAALSSTHHLRMEEAFEVWVDVAVQSFSPGQQVYLSTWLFNRGASEAAMRLEPQILLDEAMHDDIMDPYRLTAFMLLAAHLDDQRSFETLKIASFSEVEDILAEPDRISMLASLLPTLAEAFKTIK